VFLTVLSFVVLRSELPEGLLARVIVAVFGAATMTALCILLPPSLRSITAVPAVLCVAALVISTSTNWKALAKMFLPGT